MKLTFLLSLIIFVLLHTACGDSSLDHEGISASEDCVGCVYYEDGLKMRRVELIVEQVRMLTSGSLNLNLACSNVYGTGASNDWQQNNVSVTTTISGSIETASVSVVASVACTITINSYNDGTATWSPTAASTVMTLSNAGVVTSNSSAQAYNNGSGTTQWFTAGPNGGTAYSVLILFAKDPLTNSAVSLTNLSAQAVTLTVENVPAPTVSNVGLYLVPAMNGVAASYTFAATASASSSPVGTLACRYVNNTSNTYTATSWQSVNTFFNGGTGGTACPTYTPGQAGTQGNWTSIYSASNTFMVVFANTVGNLTSYVTYNVP